MPLFWKGLAKMTDGIWTQVQLMWLALSAPYFCRAPLYFSTDIRNGSLSFFLIGRMLELLCWMLA
eukprot:1141218-Pelagomonas_calceolata.AAC.3